jgi:hypothetical protein
MQDGAATVVLSLSAGVLVLCAIVGVFVAVV